MSPLQEFTILMGTSFSAIPSNILNNGGTVRLKVVQDGSTIRASSVINIGAPGSFSQEQSLSLTILLNQGNTIRFDIEVNFCCGPYTLYGSQSSASGFRLY